MLDSCCKPQAAGRCQLRGSELRARIRFKNERWSIAEPHHEKSQHKLASFKSLPRRETARGYAASDAGDIQHDAGLAVQTHSAIADLD